MRPAFWICLLVSASSAHAQWLNQPTAGIPRTPDGKPNLTAPAPRAPDGKPDLSGTWTTTSDRFNNNIAADLKPEDVLPWADALFRARRADFGKDSMDSVCLPAGPASMTGPYHDFKIVQTPALVVILFNNLLHRQVFLDGRKLEKDPNPSWMGYSVGHWDGDTLVVESNGYTTRVWLDADGHPHSEDLRITERFHRIDVGHMEIRMTLDDPKAYAKPWTVTLQQELMVDTEMLEFVCNENEKDRQHMDAKGPQLSEASLSAATLAKYVGIYDFVDEGKSHSVEITAVGGTLYWNQDGAGTQPLLPFSEMVFSLSGTQIEFLSDGGLATGFLIEMAEGDTQAVRSKENVRAK
jgi:hypothetical protein